MSNKIAILICGHLRTGRITNKSLRKNLFSRVKADIYLSTWSLEDNVEATWWRKEKKHKTFVNIKTLTRLYSPDGILIQKQAPIKKFSIDKFISHPAGALLMSTKSVLDCFNMANSTKLYARYICIRPDLQLLSPVLQREIMDINYTYFPRFDYFVEKGSISDVWWICSSDYFQKLQIYRDQELPKLLDSTKLISHQEDFLSNFLYRNKVSVKLSQTKWGLRRNHKYLQTWPGNISRIILKKKTFAESFLKIIKSSEKISYLFGNEVNINLTKKKNINKLKMKISKKFRHGLIPRFSAGKWYFKITFLKK